MAVDKVLHNYKTPLSVSYISSSKGIKIKSFKNFGVLINDVEGVVKSLGFENQSGYYLSNDKSGVIWKKPTWLEIDAPSSFTRLNTASITLPSSYRRITISQNAPQSYDGADGDIWLTFL